MKFFGFVMMCLVAGLMVACESPSASGEVSQPRTGIWIDVRTANEFNAGHLDGALHIPYDVIGDQIAAVVPDKDAEIHVYCRTGRRSGIALKTLEGMGYTNVVNEGGYAQLKGR